MKIILEQDIDKKTIKSEFAQIKAYFNIQKNTDKEEERMMNRCNFCKELFCRSKIYYSTFNRSYNSFL